MCLEPQLLGQTLLGQFVKFVFVSNMCSFYFKIQQVFFFCLGLVLHRWLDKNARDLQHQMVNACRYMPFARAPAVGAIATL